MNTFRLKYRHIWQNAENWLIILFLATFALNMRKIFLTPYSFLNGTFNEYTTLSFSWADLLMLAVIIIYTIRWLISQFSDIPLTKAIQYNVIRYKSSVIRFYYDVSRETIILLVFLVWIGLSVFWSQYKLIALYRFATFLEISFFAIIAVKSLKNQKWLRLAFFALIFNGLFQSILGIAQFVHNKSLEIHWLGESILGANIDGVAKIIIGGEKHIRAYGTLPHPNILAGFLMIPIFIILAELLNRLAFAKFDNIKVSRGTFLDVIPIWVILISFTIIFAGFLLTFSRSAFLGLTVGFLLLCFLHRKKLARQSRLGLVIIFFSAVLAVGYLTHSNKDTISLFSTQSLEERNLYQNVARETISVHPLAGVGIGQFVFEEFQKHPDLEGWEYQPVHNVYLLVFSELGAIGLALFILWLLLILEWGSRKECNTKLLLTYNVFCCIVLLYFLIFLFDHYFWDIKLGLAIFTLPILFLKIGSNKAIP